MLTYNEQHSHVPEHVSVNTGNQYSIFFISNVSI
jgi:hypothetical protein